MIEAAQWTDETSRERALDTQTSFLVQAPAGSGKTELLTQRFLKLLAEVDEPEQILAITFTLAATAEMRTRVLDALKTAQRNPEIQGEPYRLALARAALRNNLERGWNLLEQPQRLSIQTIDSLCLTIAHDTPLLARLGGTLTPTEDVEPLYALAARRTLARLGGGREELSAAIRALLELRDTSLADCERVIAEMLSSREQWGRVLPLGPDPDWPQVRSALEAPLRREHEHTIRRAQCLFSCRPDLIRELLDLLTYACANLQGSGSPLLQLKNIAQLEQLMEHQHWLCLCEFFLTSGGGWRRQLTVNHGFPRGKEGAAAKTRFAALITALDREPEYLKVLCELRDLPPCRYEEEQWRLLRHMLVILRHAAAELRVIFAERNVVDFVELGLAARQVLSDEESESAVRIAERWRHLLVDEFQDTSRSQYQLLTMLVNGWESGDRGTCFLVGDPMQSIYMFRQAEVELFERTRRYGLGDGGARISMTPLQLQTNFRSEAGVVAALNEIFPAVFAGGEHTGSYRVPFTPSTISPQAEPGAGSVAVTELFFDKDAGPQEKQAAEIAEAEQVARIIQRHWPEIEQAKREKSIFQIAVLVRARRHLTWIAGKLREAGIPFRAVEIEELNQRQEVLDLTSLVRALLHPMDRIAWLSVMRAPWCGLTLKDLHILCGSDDPNLALRPLLELLRSRIVLLSIDGQRRAGRVLGVLETALRGRHRQASFSRWVERVWHTLGGRDCVDLVGYENARVFFDMLGELPPDGSGLDEQIRRLFAEPDPQVSERSGVQLMTIHKAKGLGFDVVIVPGLEKKPAADQSALLRWLERTTLEGPEEVEYSEFLVAPIGRKGDHGDPLYRWLGKQKRKREAEEAKRLLYVACTRARKELHLFGTAIVKRGKDGSPQAAAGDQRSLLATAWPALQSAFADRLAQGVEPLTPPVWNPPAKAIQLRRLPVHWTPPAGDKDRAEDIVPLGEIRQSTAGVELFERPQGGRMARVFGVVVHALLEEITRMPEEDTADLLTAVRGWRPRAQAMLRNAGIAKPLAERQSADVVRALAGALEDPIGRWILAARKDAETESSWTAWMEEGPHAFRGDRIFLAGAEPGSLEATHMWIVDYKTAQHGPAGLDAFLASERQKYTPQLSVYAQLMRKVHGERLPLRLALYYPLLKRLVWWEY